MGLRRLLREYVLSFFHPAGWLDIENSEIQSEFSPVVLEGRFTFGLALTMLSRQDFHTTSALGGLLRAAKADESMAAVDRLAACLPEHLDVIDWPETPDVLVTLPDGRPLPRPSATRLLADRIAGHLGCPIHHDMFAKTRLCPPQKTRSWQERLIDRTPRYSLNSPEAVCGRAVLLFDDVYATGQSLGEATRLLLDGGARTVMVLVLVRLTE